MTLHPSSGREKNKEQKGLQLALVAPIYSTELITDLTTSRIYRTQDLKISTS